MESFSFFKYWKGGGGAAVVSTIRTAAAITFAPSSIPSPETDGEDADDDGPFFDLEFAVPDRDNGVQNGENQLDNERLLTFRSDQSFPLSSSEDLFFNGSPIASVESDLNPQQNVSSLRSATIFRVLMFRHRKPKSPSPASPKQNQQLRKFLVKFKVDEVPIVSLFSRESSSRNPIAGSQSPPEDRSANSKDVVQKYLNKIKPLYVRVSKRYSDKLRFSAAEPCEGKEKEAEAPTTTGKKRQKPAVPSRIRVACKHLGKSKSASLATVAEMLPPILPQRQDGFLQEQQDGIQSAIAHCKRSLTAESKGSKLPLLRSKSDPLTATSV